MSFDLFNPPALPQKKYNSQSLQFNNTFLELFAGIGGMRLAFEQLGLQSVGAFETDRFTQITYAANFGKKPQATLNTLKVESLPNFDVLLSSFKVPIFLSPAKRNPKLHPTQGTDFYQIIRVLTAKNNPAFLLETTDSLVSHNNGKTFSLIESALHELNFDIFFKILDAARFGVPQKRRRLYIVGFRCDFFKQKPNFRFPKGQKPNTFICDYLEHHQQGYSISKHFQQFYLFGTEHAQIIDYQSKLQVKTLSPSYHKVQPLLGAFVKDGETGVRLLAENECKAIMGFDKDFIIPVSRTQMYKQLGGSVVPPVIKAIGENMIRVLGGRLGAMTD